MLRIIRRSKFERDIEKIKKRGKSMDKFKEVVTLLVNEMTLPIKYRNHKLVGDYQGHWECHIEPDWLLVYQKTASEIILTRTGSHSDLF
jgi:mRNA interferase YafQ